MRLRIYLSRIITLLLFLIVGLLFTHSSNAQSCGGGNAGKVYSANYIRSCNIPNCNPRTNPFCVCTDSCPSVGGGVYPGITEFCSDQSTCNACLNVNTAASGYPCRSGTCNWGGSTSYSACSSGGGGGCNYSSWKDGSCGPAGGCSTSQRHQYRTSNTCANDNRCVADSSCVPPPPPNGPPACNLKGPANTTVGSAVTFTATCGDWEGNLDNIQILESPTGNQSWTSTENQGASGNTATHTRSISWATPGEYYVTVNGYDSSGGKCSGNPFGIPGGWNDCDPTEDYIKVTVTAATCADCPPTGLWNECTADGNFVNLHWNWVDGASNYPVRIWNSTCSSAPGWRSGTGVEAGLCIRDSSINTNSTGFIPNEPDVEHAWWVHAINNATNAWSEPGRSSFSCPSPNAPPKCEINGPITVTEGASATYTADCTDANGNLTAIGVYNSPAAYPPSWTGVNPSDPYCSVSGGTGSCSRTRTWPKAGTYYVTVRGDDATNKNCSGDPWADRGRWYDCGPNDFLQVNVVPPPNQSPTGQITATCNAAGILNVDVTTTDDDPTVEVNLDIPTYGAASRTVATGSRNFGTYPNRPQDNTLRTITGTVVDNDGTSVAMTSGSFTCDEPVVNSYFKLKNASYYTLGAISNLIPLTRTEFDGDDDNSGYVIQGAGAGMASVRQGSPFGAAAAIPNGASVKGWLHSYNSGPITPVFTPLSFIRYAQSKKNYTSIDVSNAALAPDGMYYDSDGSTAGLPWSDTIIPGTGGTVIMSGRDVSLVRNGASRAFNSGNRPFVLIVNGTLRIDPELTSLNGVFVANQVDLGASPNELKIVGNLSVTSQATTTDRARADKQKASFFVVFDSTHYVSLLDKISTSKTRWEQKQ